MLSIDLGIGLTSIAVAVRQATNYATTWSFAAYAQANGGALPGPWADVRRTGTATYENASGVITTLPDLGGGTYAARVQYRSGTARGLLIEGQATQYSPKTDELSDAASWPTNDLTVSANAGTSPAGTTTADLAYPASTGGQRRFATAVGGLATGVNTWSIYAKYSGIPWFYVFKGDGTGVAAWFNVQTGATSNVAAGYTASTQAVGGGWYRLVLTTPSVTPIYLRYMGPSSSAGSETVTANGTDGILLWGSQVEAGPVATSYIPNSGTGTVVRAADSAGVFLTSSALSAAFPGGVGQPWTTVFQYRKGYSVSSDETLFALSAGSSAGSTNLLALQTNGTQAQAVHSGGSGTLSGTLVHDGSTVNKIALSVDPTTGKVSVSVNGAAAVETTGIAFTGSGTTHLIPGARTTGGSTPVLGMEIYDWRNVNTAYTTGASLQALSA